MVRAIKEKVRVEKEGAIEIRHPELTVGSQAEVIVLIERPAEAGATAREPAGAPLWEVAAEIARTVPDEEWKRVPPDLARNLDHYLYGAPKDED